MDDAYRDLVEKEWSKMFPDERHQPPRHTLNVAPSGLRGERVQLWSLLKWQGNPVA